MRRWLWIALAAFIVSACSGQTAQPAPVALNSPAAVVVSPAATPSALGPVATAEPSSMSGGSPAMGVLVDLTSSPTMYTIWLVDAGGNVVRQVQARKRTPIATAGRPGVVLPYVSTTLTSLYYLDGDAQIRVLRLDGSTADVQRLSDAPGVESAFAVSPDDKQIAISSLDFTTSPVSLTLTTDYTAGGNPHGIFQSSSDYVWPVAWHGGLIVLAHAYGPFEDDIAKAAPGRDNPYSAISYHVVDPVTAKRVVLMGACTVSGPLSPAGSGCIQGGSIDWQGNTTDWSTHDWGSISAAAALSPDGRWMAAANPDKRTQMAIWRRSDGLIANWVDGPGSNDWAGWLDGETILVGSETNPSWQPFVVNVIRGGVVHFVAAHGFFAATLPSLID